jgi:hypothetical protein
MMEALVEKVQDEVEAVLDDAEPKADGDAGQPKGKKKKKNKNKKK